jgi:hypothetical protein
LSVACSRRKPVLRPEHRHAKKKLADLQKQKRAEVATTNDKIPPALHVKCILMTDARESAGRRKEIQRLPPVELEAVLRRALPVGLKERCASGAPEPPFGVSFRR